MRAEIGDLDAKVAYASDSPAMILTCPECATRYVVADDRVGPQGRAVRCASCGARWTAMPEEMALELESNDGEDLLDSPALLTDPFGAEAAPFAPKPLGADAPERAFRDKVQTQKKIRQAAVTGAIWAGML